MRQLLERYIRSLLEQEQSPASVPEYRQDLGTFMQWLLDRLGYRVHVRAFRHDGPRRRTATGERQWGIDIVATRNDAQVVRGYLFALKRGDVDVKDWTDEPGSLRHDVLLAADMRAEDKSTLTPGEDVGRWTVIAVHNGDFNPALKSQRENLVAAVRRSNVDLEWWDACRLVELALAAPVAESGSKVSIEERADAGLFPPGIRPFARLAIDSLVRGVDGRQFDLESVDRLVDAVLPSNEAVRAPRWLRSVSELGLAAEMIDVDCKSREEVRGSALPALEAYERCLCRAMHLLANHGGANWSHQHEMHAIDLLRELLGRYVAIACRLLEHLTPLLSLDRGLAIRSPSERIDYPLRSLRLVGYLTVAAFAALDLGDRTKAIAIVAAIEELCQNNAGGVLCPVLDDQIVELSIMWDLFRQSDRPGTLVSTAQHVAQRILLRRQFGLPMPALWFDASVPLAERTIRVLVEGQYTHEAPGFEDGGSQILPLALYLGWRDSSLEEANGMVAAVAPRQQPPGTSGSESLALRAIHMQSWLPPDDAPRRWYGESLAHEGTTHIYATMGWQSELRFSDLRAQFEAFNKPLPEASIAANLGLPSLDRLAWKRFRNPPPMSLFFAAPAPAG